MLDSMQDFADLPPGSWVEFQCIGDTTTYRLTKVRMDEPGGDHGFNIYTWKLGHQIRPYFRDEDAFRYYATARNVGMTHNSSYKSIIERLDSYAIITH